MTRAEKAEGLKDDLRVSILIFCHGAKQLFMVPINELLRTFHFTTPSVSLIHENCLTVKGLRKAICFVDLTFSS